MALVIVSTDGSVGDGAAGWAFVAGDITRAGALPSTTASHEAEWVAVSSALAWAEAALEAGDELEVHTDSALVEKGLASRRPAMSGNVAVLRASCRQALARLATAGVKARVVRVRREENSEADEAARAAALLR